MKYYRIFSIILMLLLFSFGAQAQAQDTLRINTSLKPPFSTRQLDGFFDLLLSELFHRVGLEVKFIRLPAERALQMANSGLSDGDLPRIAGLGKKYPNLIEVPEPVIQYNFVAFSKNPSPPELSWDKLSGKKVGFIIGWKIYEKNVPQTALLTKVTSPGQLFGLLAANRVDTILYERYVGKYLVAEKGMEGVQEWAPPLVVKPMHLYLHKTKRHLVNRISEELRLMKQDGSWGRLASMTLDGGR